MYTFTCSVEMSTIWGEGIADALLDGLAELLEVAVRLCHDINVGEYRSVTHMEANSCGSARAGALQHLVGRA